MSKQTLREAVLQVVLAATRPMSDTEIQEAVRGLPGFDLDPKKSSFSTVQTTAGTLAREGLILREGTRGRMLYQPPGGIQEVPPSFPATLLGEGPSPGPASESPLPTPLLTIEDQVIIGWNRKMDPNLTRRVFDFAQTHPTFYSTEVVQTLSKDAPEDFDPNDIHSIITALHIERVLERERPPEGATGRWLYHLNPDGPRLRAILDGKRYRRHAEPDLPLPPTRVPPPPAIAPPKPAAPEPTPAPSGPTPTWVSSWEAWADDEWVRPCMGGTAARADQRGGQLATHPKDLPVRWVVYDQPGKRAQSVVAEGFAPSLDRGRQMADAIMDLLGCYQPFKH